MSFQTVFKRYELKYMITVEQKQRLLEAMKPYMQLDKYGKTVVRNLYFDTNDYLLIRRSIEKPIYKEKLRIRSYCQAQSENNVFVELKKKYKHIVYKRRVSLAEKTATEWLCGSGICEKNTQICREIEYFLKYYKSLHPVVFLSYEREAFYSKDKSDFRVTFDDNILARQEDLSLGAEVYGKPILPQGRILMEIKCTGGIPIWMTKILSQEKIYKTSFSKYGTVYRTMIFPHLHIKDVYENKEMSQYV